MGTARLGLAIGEDARGDALEAVTVGVVACVHPDWAMGHRGNGPPVGVGETEGQRGVRLAVEVNRRGAALEGQNFYPLGLEAEGGEQRLGGLSTSEPLRAAEGPRHFGKELLLTGAKGDDGFAFDPWLSEDGGVEQASGHSDGERLTELGCIRAWRAHCGPREERLSPVVGRGWITRRSP